jgi:hypothetical protein
MRQVMWGVLPQWVCPFEKMAAEALIGRVMDGHSVLTMVAA